MALVGSAVEKAPLYLCEVHGFGGVRGTLALVEKAPLYSLRFMAFPSSAHVLDAFDDGGGGGTCSGATIFVLDTGRGLLLGVGVRSPPPRPC
jgi:hypothetical protein